MTDKPTEQPTQLLFFHIGGNSEGLMDNNFGNFESVTLVHLLGKRVHTLQHQACTLFPLPVHSMIILAY